MNISLPDGTEFVVHRHAPRCGTEITPARPEFIEVRDGDGEGFAQLPGWIPDAKLTDVIGLLLEARRIGLELGRRAGAEEERRKIVYGFRAILEPVVDAVLEMGGGK